MRQIPKPALRIAALVCGYPGDHRRLRQLMVLQAFIDDSEAAGEVLVLAGFLSTVEKWEAFSVAWQDRLNHAPWSVFKMVEVARRGSDEALEHAKWHYYTIRDYAERAICISVPTEVVRRSAEKYELIDPDAANPYMWAFKGIFEGLHQNQEKWGLTEPVDFIFDNRSEEQKVRDAWYGYVRSHADYIEGVVGRKPLFEDDEEFLPLQAADMLAWWCRKQWLDNKGSMPEDRFPIPWGKMGDIPLLMIDFPEETIEKEMISLSSGRSV